jgi:hypothetical protein
MKRRLFLWALATLAALPALAGQHVRVVLDTSGSMRTNDSPRLAILATLLLYDLADLERDLGDSFEVLPFDPALVWSDPASPPPPTVGPRVRARFGGRDAIVAEISGLAYNARNTYFFPGLKAALTDLEAVSGGPGSVRSLVLVTDGVPEARTRDAELDLLRRDLLPRLEASGIRLFVLAFGPEALSHRDFFETLVRGSRGQRLGRVLVDRDGTALLDSMCEIFAESFGYTRSTPQLLAGGAQLDLEGGGRAQRAAVVVSALTAGPTPSLALAPPAGGSVNAPGGTVRAATAGASYALAWVLSPDPGRYGVTSDRVPARVAVMRPSRIVLEVHPRPPLTQARQVMARVPVPLQVLARPQGGAGGDPGPIDLSFRTHGPPLPHPEPGASPYAWSSEKSAPPAGSAKVLAEGRAFSIEAEFPRDPAAGEVSYRGYLEVEAQRGGALVASLSGPAAFAVDVFPYLALSASPLAGDALPVGQGKRQPRALRRGERACSRFTLELSEGRLPHPAQPRSSVRAEIDRSALAFDKELSGALLTLDGHPLAIEGGPAPTASPWQGGLELEHAALLGEHEICVQVGRPKAGDPARALELPLRLALLESPYDSAPVIEPFVLRVWIDRPTVAERFGAALGLALAALGALLTVAALRWRRGLPGDLVYRICREEAVGKAAPTASAPIPLERSQGLGRLLTLAPALPVALPGEGQTLAWIVPATQDLFHLRPAFQVRVSRPDGQPLPATRGGRYALEIHRPFRLQRAGESYRLRLEYR